MALGVVKSNLALKPLTLLWSRPADGPILWHGLSAHPIDTLLESRAPTSPRADAEGFLRELLAGGSVPALEVRDRAVSIGIAEHTLRRAATAIGVEKWTGGGAHGHWYWRLPDDPPAAFENQPAGDDVNLPTP